MKALSLILGLILPVALFAQTATSDDATASGSKVGTGATISVPPEVGPQTAPESPSSGAIVPPPQGVQPPSTPISPANGGTGAGSTAQPSAPGTGMTSEGAGTGR